MYHKNILLSLLVSVLLLSACGSREPDTLTVMTHDSFAISEEVVLAFEEEHNVEVQFLKAGDAGSALNRAILAKDAPLADVFYGVDNTFLSRALQEDLFEPYASPLLAQIPEMFHIDLSQRALPVDYGDVCLNFDKDYFASRELAPPANLEDLLLPEYRGLTAVQNPATSSPGLAFLLATIGKFGESGYLDYWQALAANDLLVVNDWETAYYSEFSIHGGTRPIVVSYGSSPPAEVIFAETPIESPPSGVVTAERSCFRQIEFVGLLKGASNQRLGRAWIDYMLDVRFQEDLPLQMFVFPVNQTAQLPPEFVEFTTIPAETAEVAPDAIQANRSTWLQAWTDTVLR